LNFPLLCGDLKRGGEKQRALEKTGCYTWKSDLTGLRKKVNMFRFGKRKQGESAKEEGQTERGKG